jgi:TatD DNase family protein
MFYPDIHTHFRTANPYSILNSFSSINIPHSRGIHPWHIDENYKLNLHELETDLQHPCCLALGEIGLDKVCTTDFNLQQKLLIKQIEYSEKYNLPVIIHCVKASNELFQLKKEIIPTQPWIWHGFNKANLLTQTLKNEIIPSFGEAILHNESLRNELANLESRQFLLETDTSTLSIETIYKTVAQLRNQTIESLQKEQINNWYYIFNSINYKLI